MKISDKNYYGVVESNNSLRHYGIKRRSGRYPWGSGEDPYQHDSEFLKTIRDLKKSGMSEVDIAKMMGFDSSTQLRYEVSAARKFVDKENIARAIRLRDEGNSPTKIGEIMGLPESTIRGILKDTHVDAVTKRDNIVDVLKENMKNHKYIQVGSGVEYMIGPDGVTRDSLNKALYELQREGYVVETIDVEQQANPGKYTTVQVLAPAGSTKRDIWAERDQIGLIEERFVDESIKNKTNEGIEYPSSISRDRIMVRYTDENGHGGAEKEGVIELRPGVADISLGDARFAQVRIAVDGDKYMKGMAIYGYDMPDGVDVIYNTNKHTGASDADVFKKIKDDKDNPFGATIRKQRHYIDENGEEQLSPVNIVSEEGSWAEWSNSLASQMLSKQPLQLIKSQLKLAFDSKKEEYKDICALTNPVIKKQLLESYAEDCDAAAADLKAAGLPRQAWKVILPIQSLKDNEIYAPSFRDGETVVLIRYPHGGKFEIPELVVNNKNREGKQVLTPSATDAVGINTNVAQRLSGADFDGDTVLVIPNNNHAVKTSKPLKGLQGFNPTESYFDPDIQSGKKKNISDQTKQTEMGKVSNLITDMTLMGATPEELTRAVRHSMVVIDSQKHFLNYKQSEIDNGIAELKTKYQGRANAGAATLISKAGAEVRIPERKEGVLVTDPVTGKTKRQYIDPNTGEKLYSETGRTYKAVKKNSKGEKVYDADGKPVLIDVKADQEVPRMSLVKDARELSSGLPQESYYASYANGLKTLANNARKESLTVKPIPQNKEAKKKYAPEIESLDAKLNLALRNAPYEKQAQLYAERVVSEKKEAKPNYSKEDLKKWRGNAITAARERVGAKKVPVTITEKEYEAIQAGAISYEKLRKICNNADRNQLRILATPKSKRDSLSSTKLNILRSMQAKGYSTSEIADRLGVSASTVSRYANEDKDLISSEKGEN